MSNDPIAFPASKAKPHNRVAGYVCELRSRIGGHVVIYDRTRMDADHSAETGMADGYRWVITYEPKRDGHTPGSSYLACKSLTIARVIMKNAARKESIETMPLLLNGEVRRA